MVLVLLGTQDKEFKRLIIEVEKLVKKGIINEKVIVQNGNTKYESDIVECVGFLDHSTLNKYIEDASYVISHGGVGSIIEVLDKDKKVIAVPRIGDYGEHENDHQQQIVKRFAKQGYIIDGSYDLERAIESLDLFEPNKYNSNNERFLQVIEDFINK